MLQPRDAGGLGLTRAELTFALMLDPNVVRLWADFRASQVGRYTTGVEKLVHFARMLLRPETGWLWRSDDLANALGTSRLWELAASLEVPMADDLAAAVAWRRVCGASRQRLAGLARTIRKRVKMLRDPMDRIRGSVGLERPLHAMIAMHDAARDDRGRFRGRAFNVRFVQYLASRTLLQTLLRVEQFSLTTYHPDNTGHIRRNADGRCVWWRRSVNTRTTTRAPSITSSGMPLSMS